jgi:RNA polymerase sigma-70 factor (ECF subfamily)
MPTEPLFADLIRRVRAGEAEAAVDLVARFEPEIRRTIRMRLTDPRLRRVLDSVDVCQSVFGQFFARAAAGQFDLREPEQLVRLLVVMAHNRIRNHAAFQRAARRDQRRLEADGSAALAAVAGAPAGPSRVVAGRELLAEVLRRLSPAERQLADWRAQGRDWPEIAAATGEPAGTLRKRLSRALDRVTRELGLDEVHDD